MKRSDVVRLLLYLVVLAAMAAYPVRKILQFEWPSEMTELFRFKVNLYDPYDPVRGRFVRLSFGRLEFKCDQPTSWDAKINRPGGSVVYAVLDRRKDGTAFVTKLTDTPVPGSAVLKVRCRWRGRDYNPKTKRCSGKWSYLYDYPFDRFYLNEKLAPEAEKLLRSAKRGTEAELLVRIYPDGSFCVDDLQIDKRSIRDVLRSRQEKSEKK
ncbi:MAG: GDYXXLXY domain-containing protein [Victivallaceae bacterium]|nr:GDYXXLXY domain-containing protein [Victivallaceae bacterium]